MPRSADDIQTELMVVQAQSGSEPAMVWLVRRWQSPLVGHARRLTRDDDAARDVVQESWLAAARGIRRLRDPAGFRAWIFRIVSNKSADWVRKRQHERAATMRGNEASSADREGVDGVRRLRAALAGLSADQQSLLSLHYSEGLSVRELAAVFDVPGGTIKSRLHAAREQLKHMLERQNDERVRR